VEASIVHKLACGVLLWYNVEAIKYGFAPAMFPAFEGVTLSMLGGLTYDYYTSKYPTKQPATPEAMQRMQTLATTQSIYRSKEKQRRFTV
jgi:hypothetical protein